MDLYFPIAEMSLNALMLFGLGAGVGILSGMFGVGGGFLMTPLLIFIGVPPAVAASMSDTRRVVLIPVLILGLAGACNSEPPSRV